MPIRTDYINTKIKWFQKHNPKIFHEEIHQQMYELYSSAREACKVASPTKLINDMDIDYIKRSIQCG